MARNEDTQNEFLKKLDAFILDVASMPRFNGQTQVMRALWRIQHLSVFGR